MYICVFISLGSIFRNRVAGSLPIFDFLSIAILVSIKWYIILVLILFSLMTNDVCLLICLVTTCVLSLEKYLLKSFAIF